MRGNEGRQGGAWRRDGDVDASASSSISNSTAIRAGTQVVGVVRAGVFYKTVRSSRHMLRSPRAWAFDTQSLRDAKRAGAAWVELRDADTGNVYRASVAEIERYGFEFDRGFGRQVALELSRWQVNAPGVVQPSLLGVSP